MDNVICRTTTEQFYLAGYKAEEHVIRSGEQGLLRTAVGREAGIGGDEDRRQHR